MSMFQKQFPQIYHAWEISNSFAYPHAPIEPLPPKPIDSTPPTKYPNLKDNLKTLGVSAAALFVSLLISYFFKHYFFIILSGILFIFFVAFIYKSAKSISLRKTYIERLIIHKEVLKKFEEDQKRYEELHSIYESARKDYEKICASLKTPKDLFNYRYEQRQIFLRKVKSKSRFKDFFEIDGVKNPRLGRAEFSFRSFLETAKKNHGIPTDLEFYFDTAVMFVSNSGMKAYYYYPDIIVITPRGLIIDVEIDEPYVSETKQPIHCVGLSDYTDFNRNKEFTSMNCSVIRFTERQIIKYPNICLQIICAFDDYAIIPPDMPLPDDFIEKAWDVNDAKQMAIENYRDTY